MPQSSLANPPLPGPNPPPYRVAEVYMFDTCTHKCGYCWLAESGQVLDFAQLEPFRDKAFIERVTSFFVSRTTPETKWLLQLTGGEPLMAPNLDRLALPLIEAGNRIAFYTALLLGRDHPGFRFLLEHPHPQVDYVMASFHPEAETNEQSYFEKIRLLKDAGHKVFLRFVGHPQRLHRLRDLSEKCRQMDICFYPTTLLSNSYPDAYTPVQADALRGHFSSLSQHIQLLGGLDTTGLQCYGGSRVIAVNLQTGNITPCISVHRPSLGNVFENRLELQSAPITCPEPGLSCICDVHFQQNVVISGDDRSAFDRQLNGFVPPADFQPQLAELRDRGVAFQSKPTRGMGDVADDTRLFYTIDEIRENFRKAHGLPRTALTQNDLRELADLRRSVCSAGAHELVHHADLTRIVTPAAKWAYAGFAALELPPNPCGEIWLRIRATVVRGQAGFGVLNRSGTEFQERVFLNPGTDEQRIFLRLADAHDAKGVIIQNGALDGPTEVLLREAMVLVGVPPTPDSAPSLPEHPSILASNSGS